MTAHWHAGGGAAGPCAHPAQKGALGPRRVTVGSVTVDTGVAKGAPAKNEPKGPGADIMKKMQGPPAGMPAMGGGNGPGFVSGTKPIPIEPAYTSASSTPLSAEVKRGANTFNFEVK